MVDIAVYVGTGLHIKPLKSFAKKFKKFVFIDSLPLNGFGYDYYYRGFYQNNFIELLNKKLVKYNFVCVNNHILTNDYEEINRENLESTLRIYNHKYNDNIVHYYTSTCVPFHLSGCNLLKSLEYDLSKSSTLIISGHHPDSAILEYMKKPIDLICYSKTLYPRDLDELLSIEEPNYNNKQCSVFLRRILEEPEFKNLINTISNYNEENNELKTFSNYNDFYKSIEYS